MKVSVETKFNLGDHVKDGKGLSGVIKAVDVKATYGKVLGEEPVQPQNVRYFVANDMYVWSTWRGEAYLELDEPKEALVKKGRKQQ